MKHHRLIDRARRQVQLALTKYERDDTLGSLVHLQNAKQWTVRLRVALLAQELRSGDKDRMLKAVRELNR